VASLLELQNCLIEDYALECSQWLIMIGYHSAARFRTLANFCSTPGRPARCGSPAPCEAMLSCLASCGSANGLCFTRGLCLWPPVIGPCRGPGLCLSSGLVSRPLPMPLLSRLTVPLRSVPLTGSRGRGRKLPLPAVHNRSHLNASTLICEGGLECNTTAASYTGSFKLGAAYWLLPQDHSKGCLYTKSS
jgi:hypothetical protein